MDIMIAYCGLDCRKCDAYIATQTHDEELRCKVAERWSKINGMKIDPDTIHCDGCRADGVKTEFCHSLCDIKMCASLEEKETCGSCDELMTCSRVRRVIGNNKEALNNLIQKG